MNNNLIKIEKKKITEVNNAFKNSNLVKQTFADLSPSKCATKIELENSGELDPAQITKNTLVSKFEVIRKKINSNCIQDLTVTDIYI